VTGLQPIVCEHPGWRAVDVIGSIKPARISSAPAKAKGCQKLETEGTEAFPVVASKVEIGPQDRVL